MNNIFFYLTDLLLVIEKLKKKDWKRFWLDSNGLRYENDFERALGMNLFGPQVVYGRAIKRSCQEL